MEQEDSFSADKICGTASSPSGKETAGQENRCFRCGRNLTADEVGLYRKMVQRGARRFLCISCLSRHFQCTEELLREKIELFRSMGCTLFSQKAVGGNRDKENISGH